MAKEADGGNHLRRIPRALRRFNPLAVTPHHLKKLRMYMPRSHYTCPVCRTPFSTRDRPIHVPALQSMATATIQSTQNGTPSGNRHPGAMESSGTWDGIFRA